MLNRAWKKISLRLRRLRRGSAGETPIQRTAAVGELHAARILRRKGYRILDRNWRCPLGEIDIVAARADTLVVAEVKTRTQEEFGAPEESVGARKRRRLVSLAHYYMKEKELTGAQPRFDVFSVLLDRAGRVRSCEHFENAFDAPGFQP